MTPEKGRKRPREDGLFRHYDLPADISLPGLNIAIGREDGPVRYLRECNGDKAEKLFFAENPVLMLAPVEPLNTPKDITSYLQIEFEVPVTLGPKTLKKIYLRYPLEIGAFLAGKGGHGKPEAIDIFSLSPAKYTLYGDPGAGLICKYYKSPVCMTLPPVEPAREGIIEVNLNNKTSGWVTVKKAVFNAYRMKIFYDASKTAMKATMLISDKNMAETDFDDHPLEKGMSKAPELYLSRGLPILAAKFVMEWGL